jgi:hypothetical protein
VVPFVLTVRLALKVCRRCCGRETQTAARGEAVDERHESNGLEGRHHGRMQRGKLPLTSIRPPVEMIDEPEDVGAELCLFRAHVEPPFG